MGKFYDDLKEGLEECIAYEQGKKELKETYKVKLTKDGMINLLEDYAYALYNDNPPPGIFEDNRQYIKDFVDGYFDEHRRICQ